MTTQDQTNQCTARIIPSKTTRKMCGGVSDMTLWRWLQDESLSFPKPTYIQKRRYWREADIVDWLESRENA